MADYVDHIVNNNTVWCNPHGYDHTYMWANFWIRITPNAAKTAYTIQIWTQTHSDYQMQWSGHSWLRVTCSNNLGYSQSGVVDTETEMRFGSNGGTSSWQGPCTFTFGYPGVTSFSFSIDLDLTRTTGSYGGRGPSHSNRTGNFQHFYCNTSVDVSSVPLIVKPTIANLKNTNQYNNQDGVSASQTSISIGWDKTGGNDITSSWYRLNDGIWVQLKAVTSHTITGLAAGTSYKITVCSSNSAGDSNYLTKTIRTKHLAPVISMKYNSSKLESLLFDWTSDKDLAYIQYRLDDSEEWINIEGSGKSGTIEIKQLEPKTKHVVYLKGVATSTYDDLESNTVYVEATTLDRSHITSISDIIFGLPFSIEIQAESSNMHKLIFWVGGNNKKEEFIIDNISKGTFTYTPKQEELDRMYKCFTNKNQVPISLTLVTKGEWKDWEDETKVRELVLTGIAKTSHIRLNGATRRAQCLVGVDGVPRRAVAWIGIEGNIPKRCI